MTFNFSGSYNVADAEQSQNVIYTNTIVCNVWLLDGTCVSFKVDKNCLGQGLLDLTFDYLELLERDFFGLVYNLPQSRDGLLVKWVNPTKKIRKQFKANPPFTFWFRVKFYVPNPICLHEEYTRYQFFLQVRKDILEGRLPVSKSSAAHLAGLALQSELGDFSTEDCRPGYVSQFRFVPQQTAEFEAQASEWHRKSTSMLPSAAELEYLNVARNLERYGTKVQEVLEENENRQAILLGVSHAGITVFRNTKLNSQFSWENVLKIQFWGKKFTVYLKTPTSNVLPVNGSVSALNRTASNSTLASPGVLGGTNATTGTSNTTNPAGSLVHTFRFSSSAMAKLFWQYAVACHAFFRVREPSAAGDTRGIGGFGLRGNVTPGTTTSISATALYAAITRATGGFRRYFSLARRGSTVTSSLSGPVGGIGRTLSTVMELRRNSRVFDRGFSRTSSRRANRRSLLSSTMNVTFATSSEMCSASNNSLAEPSGPVASINTIPLKTYTQMPPPGARASYAGKHWNSKQTDSGTVAINSRYSSMSVTSSRQPKRQALTMSSSVSTSYPQAQQDSHPVGSRGLSNTADKPARVRGSKPGSPTATGRSNQRRATPASPGRSHAETTSPKSLRRTPEPRGTDKRRQSSAQFADENDLDGLDDSDQSDSEVTIDGGDFDETEATRYWHHRRTQAVRGPGRTISSSRNRTSSGTSHGQSSRPDVSTKRRPAPDPVTSSELPPGTEMVYKTGFSKTSCSSTHRIPPTGSAKKIVQESAVVQRKEVRL